jgi:Xaa-Pro aminopeptidase
VVSRAEIDRRYSLVREAMAAEHLDALVVCGSEYTGFEGAVTYMSGFVIVHRYAYVILPLEGEPTIVFPAEARYVGEHGTCWIEDQVFVDRPGQYIGERWKANRVGVYGLDYVMAVRDFEATDLQELVPFDLQFDLARAVKSEAELESVRD